MVQCNGDRIGRIILLGSCGKRKEYFEKAVSESGINYNFCSYDEFDAFIKNEDLSSCILKIDPPVMQGGDLSELKAFTDKYRNILDKLSGLSVLGYFNSPAAIYSLLDKKKCRQVLKNKNIPVTHMYDVRPSCVDELLVFMTEKHIPQVFVKPVTGSGAAGVTAVRFSGMRNSLIAYTCAFMDGNTLINTKKLRKIENGEAGRLLDALLSSECIIEKWHSKSVYNGYSYDLRVVMQEGHTDYILPRLSKGPVTNLHLNDHAEYFEKIGLDASLTDEINDICRNAVSCFAGLRSAGIDVLIEHGKPMIIEMNAQGDLIYQDIYNENRIYKSQVKIIKNIFEKKEIKV